MSVMEPSLSEQQLLESPEFLAEWDEAVKNAQERELTTVSFFDE